MKKYVVKMVDEDTGEVLEIDDEIFDTYEEAYEYSLVSGSNYSAGAEVLKLAGESYGDPDEVDFIVEEVDD